MGEGCDRTGRASSRPAVKTRVRCDRPGRVDPGALDSVRGGIVAWLFYVAIGRYGERRRDLRRTPAAAAVWLGWTSAEGFVAVPGVLLDVSRGGGRIVLPERPPWRRPVWVYSEASEVPACVRSELVGLTPAPSGNFAARLRFRDHASTVFLQAVLCGGQKNQT